MEVEPPQFPPISPADLLGRTASGGKAPPVVIDVRREPAFLAASDAIAGALRRDPGAVDDWAGTIPAGVPVVVYCVHGHQVSQGAAAALRKRGFDATFLDHGIEGWREAGGALTPKPAQSGAFWVTRARPKIDRIACPWLVSRFIDPGAQFLYVPTGEVLAVAAARPAIAYDIAGGAFTHDGERCSFDAILRCYRLEADPALARLAVIVRAADTDRLDLAPQAPGLLAISQGLSRLFEDDHAMLAHGMVLYDALYRWCRAQVEAQGVDPARLWAPVTAAKGAA
jgi:rhodanese-related sulfurtransferase